MQVLWRTGLLATSVGLSGLLLLGCTQQLESESAVQTAPTATAESPSPGTEAPQREPDVIYVPTPQAVVDEMLTIANVSKDDVVYDLGSGDGRIPITAAAKYRARGVGIDINPDLIREARENAQKAGVTDLVEFRQEDLFESDFREASVVTLYLLSSLNLKLRPKLFQELKPGTRVVSHAFDMGDWKPEQTRQVTVDGSQYTIYYWTIPEEIPANLRN
jgi:SAM-dependent methyltransferase